MTCEVRSAGVHQHRYCHHGQERLSHDPGKVFDVGAGGLKRHARRTDEDAQPASQCLEERRRWNRGAPGLAFSASRTLRRRRACSQQPHTQVDEQGGGMGSNQKLMVVPAVTL
jgi:hypothetical protein